MGAGGDGPRAAQARTTPTDAEEGQGDVDVESGERATMPVDNSQYNIEFTFDSDVTCKITVMYFAKEELINGVAV